MRGVIVTNGYYFSPASVNQAERVREELQRLGAEVEIIKNNKPHSVGTEFDYDFAVFFDKDVNFAKILEESGVAVFNSSSSIENADDKLKTAVILESANISHPKTVPAPKRYVYDGADREFLKRTAEILGYPIVIKEAVGSLGEQVYLANNFDDLVTVDERIGNRDKLYQEYIAESRGKSIRAIVIGKKLVCAVEFSNGNDFRSNAHNGGKGKRVELNEEFKTTAEKTAAVFGLDYCGVDMFVSAPTVIEVNSNAYFKSTESVTGENIALTYAEYIIKTTEELKECRNLLGL